MSKYNKTIGHAWRRATAKKRVLPDVAIIGAQRSGTTSLFQWLQRSPGFREPLKKEVHYFTLHYANSLNWYRAFFPTRAEMEEAITGEATPYAFFHPLGATRLKETIPDAKLIVVLRNPVNRAWSNYCMERAAGREELSFQEAIEKEEVRTKDWFGHRHFSYVSRGYYARQLERWLGLFSLDQFIVISSEQMFSTPQAVMNGLYDQLGVPRVAIGSEIYSASYKPTSVPEAAKQRLESMYKEENRRLYDMLGRDFGWPAA